MPPKTNGKGKKRVNESESGDEEVNGVNGTPNTRATTENMLNLCDICVEQPNYENLSSGEKCRVVFDDISANYVKITDLLCDLDNVRCRLVNNLTEVQKKFRSYNVGGVNEALGDNKVIQEIVHSAMNNLVDVDPVVVDVKDVVVAPVVEDVKDVKGEEEEEEVVVAVKGDEPKKKVAVKKVAAKVVVKGKTTKKVVKPVEEVVVEPAEKPKIKKVVKKKIPVPPAT